MRQNFRSKEKDVQNIIIIAIVCVSILIISLIAYLIYNSNSEVEVVPKETIDISSENGDDYETEDFESASSQIGKKVEESEEEYENANVISNTTNKDNENQTGTQNVSKSDTESKETNSNVVGTNQTSENTIEVEETENEQEESETKISFKMPIVGEILREFASDSLVYSETLQEWITHNGIDIKADKTSVVTSVADGKVQSIKNDPRYGLTVIVNHDNGYQSIYSNLLTAEFVVEGEEVKQGQTIGTVGNSASFEICDDYHLHFELLKDSQYLDPTIYLED